MSDTNLNNYQHGACQLFMKNESYNVTLKIYVKQQL